MQETLYQIDDIQVEVDPNFFSSADQDFYVPTEAECVEMMETYRLDYQDDVSLQDEFDEWLINLSDRDLTTMRRAIDDIRRILKSSHMSLPVPVLAGWIDLD